MLKNRSSSPLQNQSQLVFGKVSHSLHLNLNETSPGALPDPETLYDELEASRKEIATQKQLINAQVK